MSEIYVYLFEEAYGLGKELLGGKGAGLAEMTHIGVSIPQGFTITTEACTLYYENEKKNYCRYSCNVDGWINVGWMWSKRWEKTSIL